MLFKNMISFILSFFLWSNSTWATVPNAEQISASDVEMIVKKINEKNDTFYSAVGMFALFDIKNQMSLRIILSKILIIKI